MPSKERDVIILDEEDDATSLKGCLAAVSNSKTLTDQLQQHPPHLNLKHYFVASVQSGCPTPSAETPTTTSQNSHAISQASRGAHYLQGSSNSVTKWSSRWLPQSPGKKTPKTNSNLDPAYFANSSWSFPTPAATCMDFATPSRPAPSSSKAPRLGCGESASATMIPSKPLLISQGPHLPSQPITTELTDDDDSADEEELALWMTQDAEDEMRRQSLASFKSKPDTSRKCSTIIPRNLPISSPLVSLETFTHNGIPLAEKVYVELEDRDFLRIVHIIQDTSTSVVTLRGWKFRRTREMNGVIDRKLNEVCWILHIDEDDPRDAKLQGMETVSVCEVVKRRRIRLTNQSFPALSWRDDGKKESPETVENDRVLVCRFKYLCFYANAKARTSYKWSEKGFHRIQEDECDQRLDNDTKDEELRNIWRGSTEPGGAQEGWLPGEREYLRQEGVSHQGIASRSSLKIPLGPEFPIGDPMKRGSVGSLLTEHDLQRSSNRATQSTSLGESDLGHTDDTIMSNDNVEEVPTLSILRSREQRQDRRKSHFNFAGFNGFFIDSSDYDTDDEHSMSTLRRDLRQSSIQPRKSRNKSPRIVEIDAQVKTSSSSGTFEKRYEGKITSRYYPKPGKRPADISFGSPARPTKRVDGGFRAESIKGNFRNRYVGPGSRTLPGNIRYSHLEPASSDGDRTLGRSQSPDDVEEMYTPSRSRGYETTLSGLLTPVSSRKDSALRRSRGTNSMQTPGVPDLAQYTQRSAPLSKIARSSAVNQTQAYGTTEDDDGIVDLTRPQASPYRTLPGARPSVFGHSGPSTPLYARSVLPSDPYKTSSSREKSSRPMAHPPFNSNSHFTSTEMRQNPQSISPGSLPVDPESSQAYRMLSHRSSKATPGPSSRPIEKTRQHNRSTFINARASKANQRRYTFGDCFCGAGGMSRGAVSAGLRINWGFDFNLAACQTYEKNFFRTLIYNVWANHFLEAKGDHKVDILHLSPPCQFFSDAHTVQGKDDDMNTASLFAIFNLLLKAKPRIVTLEQTSGLIRRHAIFFNAVINMLTSRGFSVRWKVMNCADFGLPQRRMRLFILASCPGEALPPFPSPTHSSNPEKTGLKPWTTINEAIAKIPHGWANHDIHLAKDRDNSPQSGDRIATCVTTSGGGIIHPSGKRDYTHREFACLQSFPLGHKFGASGVKKQIGNAVPPTMATILLVTVKNALLKADGLM
ncbi:MAG: hypothetical protein ALECFALPRED_007179 [Alectoria fallacina]|uniref:DNA (cytosine-5-)-methyltransferase n=1 Tax=Alectoria fallacina TaxID=1903189 RepID=A0A8H3GCE6_9LECA|nr:MAG: hypothetical protein ALECFALPRED_007179 [Alectoria fallacina]